MLLEYIAILNPTRHEGILILEVILGQSGGNICRKLRVRLHAVDGGDVLRWEAVDLVSYAGADVEGDAGGGEEELWYGCGVFVLDPWFFWGCVRIVGWWRGKRTYDMFGGGWRCLDFVFRRFV